MEENFTRKIIEIKQIHLREKEMLQQKAYSATKELDLLKMDHSELIRNTKFEDMREHIEELANA